MRRARAVPLYALSGVAIDIALVVALSSPLAAARCKCRKYLRPPYQRHGLPISSSEKPWIRSLRNWDSRREARRWTMIKPPLCGSLNLRRLCRPQARADFMVTAPVRLLSRRAIRPSAGSPRSFLRQTAASSRRAPKNRTVPRHRAGEQASAHAIFGQNL